MRFVEPREVIDRSVKALCRRVPQALLQLLRLPVTPSLSWEDASVTIPGHRGDQVLVVGEPGDPERWALHLEYQLTPDPRLLRDWQLKNAGFAQQLDVDVLTVALYLSPGERASFPDRRLIERGSLRNEWRFQTVRLWEHADRIRSGELSTLAPLLLLCEDSPAEETVRQELELLRGAPVTEQVRAELLSLAMSVATRYLAKDLLWTVFREEAQMLKEASIIEEWIAEGEARGEARGELQRARRMALLALRGKFDDIPPNAIAKIEKADSALCDHIVEGVGRARSLADLGL